MNGHQNSLDVWHGEVKPNLRKRQLQVLKVYQKVGQGTATDIMEATGQPRNVIHPRIGELRDAGCLKEIGNKKIGRHYHAILQVTEKGLAVNTKRVEDIAPAQKYYSKADYQHFCRAFYNHLAAQPDTTENGLKWAHEKLTKFLVSKK